MDDAVRLLGAGDAAGAAAVFEAMVKGVPTDAVALGNWGMALQKANRGAAAESAYRRAIALAPGRAEFRYNLATLLLSQGRRDEAAVMLRGTIALAGDKPQLRAEALMARLLAEMRAHPDSPAPSHTDPVAALMQRGLTLKTQGLGEAATACFHDVLAIDPAHGLAAYLAGEACLWAGRLDECRRDLTVALRWMAGRWSEPAEVPAPKPRFDREAARTVLFHVIDALQAVGIRCFLNGGTALGCVREGDFIGFDSDIDLGVMPGTDAAAVIEAIDTDPALSIPYHDVFRDEVIRVRFQGTSGVGGDVFLYQQDEQGLWCGVQRGPHALRWRDTPFDVQETAFLGRLVWLPAPPERYLVENYGPGWVAPDPDHIPGFSAPNLMEPDSLLVRCTIYCSIMGAMARRDAHQVRRYCTEAVARFPDDALLAGTLTTIGAALP